MVCEIMKLFLTGVLTSHMLMLSLISTYQKVGWITCTELDELQEQEDLELLTLSSHSSYRKQSF